MIPVFQELVLAQASGMGLLSDVTDEHVWRRARSWGRMPPSNGACVAGRGCGEVAPL